MSPARSLRCLAIATLTLIAWLTVSAGVSFAKTGPDDPLPAVPTEPRTVVLTTVDWSQLAVTAAVACLIGVAATLAIQFVLHRAYRPSPAHA